jgi:hypothetical protein
VVVVVGAVLVVVVVVLVVAAKSLFSCTHSQFSPIKQTGGSGSDCHRRFDRRDRPVDIILGGAEVAQ